MTPYIAEEVSLAAHTTSKSTCPKPPWQPQPPPTQPATSPPIPRPTRLTLRSLPAQPPIWLTCPSPPTKTCLPPPHTPLTRQDILLIHPSAHIPIFQPSQYLNNNLGGHRGDIDEVSHHPPPLYHHIHCHFVIST